MQARATLKHMLQTEIAERKQAIAECRYRCSLSYSVVLLLMCCTTPLMIAACREKAAEVDRHLAELKSALPH